MAQSFASRALLLVGDRPADDPAVEGLRRQSASRRSASGMLTLAAASGSEALLRLAQVAP